MVWKCPFRRCFRTAPHFFTGFASSRRVPTIDDATLVCALSALPSSANGDDEDGPAFASATAAAFTRLALRSDDGIPSSFGLPPPCILLGGGVGWGVLP